MSCLSLSTTSVSSRPLFLPPSCRPLLRLHQRTCTTPPAQQRAPPRPQCYHLQSQPSSPSPPAPPASPTCPAAILSAPSTPASSGLLANVKSLPLCPPASLQGSA